jgi:predicted dinucleotide-binding enzyme
MKISILGTGMVGQVIAEKMMQLGHVTFMGTRNAAETIARQEPNRMTGISFADWHASHTDVQLVNFEDLPTDTDIWINASSGQASLEVLKKVTEKKLSKGVLLDLANPLNFSNGMPPSLAVCNTDSLAETIQRAFPSVKVVKSLNTMNCTIMMDPSLVPGDHQVFVCGDHDGAKRVVVDLLREVGWIEGNILDLGGLVAARGTEMMLPVWLQIYGKLGTGNFNFNVVRG